MAIAAPDLAGTVSVVGTRAMLGYAAALGVDVDVLLAEVGLPRAALADADGRIPVALDRRIWELAAVRSGDPAFGLHVAHELDLGTFEALDYAMWSSATLEDALDRFARFYRLIGDDAALRIERRGRRAHLVRARAHDVPARAETFVAGLLLRARELVARPLAVDEVRFANPAPSDTRAYRALFRCPVRFGAATTELVIAAAALVLPVHTARPGLARVLDRHMGDLLARLPEPTGFERRVHHAIALGLGGGRPPSLAATARALHAAPRTIQRRLQELGWTHRGLVESVRRDLAESLLASSRLSLTDIAFLLGFEDVSGFYRAYRRWTGHAPSRRRNAPRG